MCGGFYGPWFYLVICITGAYLAGDSTKEFILFLGQFYHVSADVILLYSLFIKTNDGKPGCDFSNQKVWIWIWEIINILAIVGLIIALGELAILFSIKLKNKKKLKSSTKNVQVGIAGWASGLCSMILFILLSS